MVCLCQSFEQTFLICILAAIPFQSKIASSTHVSSVCSDVYNSHFNSLVMSLTLNARPVVLPSKRSLTSFGVSQMSNPMSQITKPILGMFVLIWMHFSWSFQILNFNNWSYFWFLVESVITYVTWSRGMSQMSLILNLSYRMTMTYSYVLHCFKNDMCNIGNSKLIIADKWLISLDHVTYVSLQV